MFRSHWIFHDAPGKFSTAPTRLEPLLYTPKSPSTQLTAPALVKTFSMTFVLVPVRFNTPLLLMVIACPANAPPDQVSDPPIVTGLLHVLVPPVDHVTVS